MIRSNVTYSAALAVLILSLIFSIPAHSQPMTLQDVIAEARTNSVQALEARSAFVSDYWSWRSYQASHLPSVHLYGTVGSFDRSLRLLQNYETGEMVYTENYNMENSIGLSVRQNITATGGTLTMYNDLTRIDQFGTGGLTWYAQPFTVSYSQPLFSYNRFKWDKLISPKQYEKAKRVYLESMEKVTLSAVDAYFDVMVAQETMDAAVRNHDNTARMLSIAGERLLLGTVTRDEYLQLELRMLNDSIAVSEDGVSLRKARMQLNSLLRLDESHEVETVLEDELPDVVLEYARVQELVDANSSLGLAGSIEILNAESAVASAKASRGVTMQLNARFGLSKTSPELAQVYRNLPDQEVVGLTFSIPIFDWGEGKGKVRKAEAAADVIRAQVEREWNDMRISLYTAVGQFNNQRRLCDVSRRASLVAAERYSLMMEKFSAGNASVTDLNTARSESDAATAKYIADVSSYWRYYYTLRKLTLHDFIARADLEVDYSEMTR